MTTGDIKQQFIEAGQGHLFEYWDSLSSEEQGSFIDQLSAFSDPKKLLSSVQEAIKRSNAQKTSGKRAEPLPGQSYSSLLETPRHEASAWESRGLELINRGEVGVILMAGGQGSRLGSSRPKGCYDIGLPSHKSLFQIQAEKIRRVVQLSNERHGNDKGKITWYIMTSAATRSVTEEFFAENGNFGFARDELVFFNQGTLPCFSADGSKILLQDRNSICESPDGNGGFYKGIYTSKLLDDFERRGIRHIHMYCVDNCLVKVADPVFIGWSAVNGYELSTKVVRKRNASESVGLIVLDADQNCPTVIEYSEISKELAGRQNADGSLYLKSANIVNHYYSVELLKREISRWISSQEFLPFHIAKKKIANVAQPAPTEPNGIKLEQFIFDVFPFIPLDKFGCLEVDRHEEFSPLKNAPGSANDCPETARADSLGLSTRWVVENGGVLASPGALVEVSPLSSYAGEGLECVKGQVLQDGAIV